MTFLIVVSALLAWQAIDRLAADTPPEVDAAWWAFVVLGVVIVVDASRAIAQLPRGARAPLRRARVERPALRVGPRSARSPSSSA